MFKFIFIIFTLINAVLAIDEERFYRIKDNNNNIVIETSDWRMIKQFFVSSDSTSVDYKIETFIRPVRLITLPWYSNAPAFEPK
jgi:hypothetical protein